MALFDNLQVRAAEAGHGYFHQHFVLQQRGNFGGNDFKRTDFLYHNSHHGFIHGRYPSSWNKKRVLVDTTRTLCLQVQAEIPGPAVFWLPRLFSRLPLPPPAGTWRLLAKKVPPSPRKGRGYSGGSATDLHRVPNTGRDSTFRFSRSVYIPDRVGPVKEKLAGRYRVSTDLPGIGGIHPKRAG
jgi:hypothetical protein